MLNVFIVDDHALFRRGVKDILSETADIVVGGEASSGPEALKGLCEGTWHAIVLDIGLPGENGLDVLKQIRSKWPLIPVVVLSSFPEESFGIRMMSSGASGYLNKESAPESLAVALRKVAAGGKYIPPALAEALAQRLDPAGAQPPHFSLSEREFEVMLLIGNGQTIKQIARKLDISDKTVATYRQRVLEKMKMNGNLEIVRYVVENHLCPPNTDTLSGSR